MIIWFFIFFFIVSQIIIERAVAYCCLSTWFSKDVGFTEVCITLSMIIGDF